MSSFIDGPAAGVSLMLKRAPVILRAVVKGGKWDAMDDPADELEHGEEVYLYIRIGDPICGFWDGRDKSGKRTGGQFNSAEYKLFHAPPPPEYLKDNPLFFRWCETNKDFLWSEKEKIDAEEKPKAIERAHAAVRRSDEIKAKRNAKAETPKKSAEPGLFEF